MLIQEIENNVCRAFRINPEYLHSKNRESSLVFARYCIFKIAREENFYTLQEIGRYFNKSHCTIIYGINQIDNVIELKKKFDFYKELFLLESSDVGIIKAYLKHITTAELSEIKTFINKL